MNNLSPNEATFLAKYLIQLGASKIDIAHCFLKNNIEPHLALLLVEMLLLAREITRDDEGNLHLTNRLEDVPQHIIDIAHNCMKAQV